MRINRKIAVLTTGRSDYGALFPILKKIMGHSKAELRLYVTGMHLSTEFGLSVNEIVKDGFDIDERIEISLASDTPEAISKSVGLAILAFSQVFTKNRPDILLVMGDRYETFAAVAAAAPFMIPVAHMAGGETTIGVIDDMYRHAITKMSHIHFPTNRSYAERLKRMGEENWRIVTAGDPVLDMIRMTKTVSKSVFRGKFNINPKKKICLITYHPETLEYEKTGQHVELLLKALGQFDFNFIFSFPNSDTGGRVIIEKIKRFIEKRDNCTFAKYFGHEMYLSALKHSDLMVGNSSSGIVESPAFHLPVVNVGMRQHGRLVAENVINCGYFIKDMVRAIERCLDKSFQAKVKNIKNPYGEGHAAKIIVKSLNEVPLNKKLIVKKFNDNFARGRVGNGE